MMQSKFVPALEDLRNDRRRQIRSGRTKFRNLPGKMRGQGYILAAQNIQYALHPGGAFGGRSGFARRRAAQEQAFARACDRYVQNAVFFFPSAGSKMRVRVPAQRGPLRAPRPRSERPGRSGGGGCGRPRGEPRVDGPHRAAGEGPRRRPCGGALPGGCRATREGLHPGRRLGRRLRRFRPGRDPRTDPHRGGGLRHLR